MLRLQPEKINWDFLSRNPNPNAMELLRVHPEKIYWPWLSNNPAIFELDYQKMKESKRELNEAIVAEAWHPKRMARWIELGLDIDDL